MSSESFTSFSTEFNSALSLVNKFSGSAMLDLERMAASGIFIQCVSIFEVFFEDCIDEFCQKNVSILSDRHLATILHYSINKQIFMNYLISGDEREFIGKLEKEFAKQKKWLNVKTLTKVESQQLIGKKDYPKPEHIILALYKLGKEENAGTKLSSGLGDNFKNTLERILDLRNTIAHVGIPQEWNPNEISTILNPLMIIAKNLDAHLFS